MLKDKIKGINKWIEENPNISDPNLYEMAELYIEIGKEAYAQNVADTENKYPIDEDLQTAYEGMSQMSALRKLDFLSLRDNQNELVTIDDPIISLLDELSMRAQIGEYQPLNDQPKAQFLKENLLKKLLSVGLHIRQLERDNSDAFYDNVEEMAELETMYRIYMEEFEKMNYRSGDLEGKPQFGYEMEPVMEMIRQKYKPFDLDEETLSKMR